MNFFEKQLRLIFDHTIGLDDVKYIGRSAFVPIDNNLKMKATFVTCGTVDNYEALQLSLFNKNEGIVDTTKLNFSDYFTKDESINKIPRIWFYDGIPKWYGDPTPPDIEAISLTAAEYIDTFMPEQQNGISMNM